MRVSTPVNKMSKHIKIALLQLNGGADKTQNLENALNHIRKAKEDGAELVALPECFNSPYGTEYFDHYAENISGGPTTDMLSKAAKENAIYLVGGTFPERDGDKLYNTCTVWNPEGKMIAKYRKMHLFDVDCPGKITFQESSVLTPGKEQVVFSVNGVKIGVGICFDMHFEEWAKLYRMQGCEMLIFPAAFHMTLGPLHYELVQRSRALDNQVFCVTISPSSAGTEGYIAWGHSQITSPWGEVLVQAGHDQEIISYEIDASQVAEMRKQMPLFEQRRTDFYNTVKVTK